jgi:hypothetical protein
MKGLFLALAVTASASAFAGGDDSGINCGGRMGACSSSTSSPTGPVVTHHAVLKFLPHYNPSTEGHDGAFVSTSENPLSGEVLMDRMTTGVCYKGQPNDVETLIVNMLDIAAADGVSISNLTLNTSDEAPATIYLQFQVNSCDDANVITYSSIPACSK